MSVPMALRAADDGCSIERSGRRFSPSLRRIAGSAVLLLSIGCQESDAPTEPSRIAGPSGPSLVISDGARGGTGHFFFLAPTVIPQPLVRPVFGGVFDPGVNTIARVCEASLPCGAANAIATFTPTGGTGGSLLAQIRVSTRLQSYSAIWDTRRCDGVGCALDPAKSYRLQVHAVPTPGAEFPIGFADLQVLTRTGTTPLDLAGFSPIIPGLPYVIAYRVEVGLSLGAVVFGNTPHGGSIHLDSREGGTGFSATTVPDGNGDFAFSGVPFGEYDLSVWQTATCVVAGGPVTVDQASVAVGPMMEFGACPADPKK